MADTMTEMAAEAALVLEHGNAMRYHKALMFNLVRAAIHEGFSNDAIIQVIGRTYTQGVIDARKRP